MRGELFEENEIIDEIEEYNPDERTELEIVKEHNDILRGYVTELEKKNDILREQIVKLERYLYFQQHREENEKIEEKEYIMI